MDEEESEVFEITDFTTASQWERFIASLEEIIHEWKLTNIVCDDDLDCGDLSKKWSEVVEQLDFAGFQFVVRRHYLQKTNNPDNKEEDSRKEKARTAGDKEALETSTKDASAGPAAYVWRDMLSIKNDFPPVVHHLSRWFGIRDFIVIQPGEKMEDILTESRMNILLSSVAVAVNNTACGVPVFVSVHQAWRKLYQGLYSVPGFRTSFETVQLKKAPRNFTHMCGLTEVFRGKVASPLPFGPQVSVAARFTYFLQDWALASWSQAPPDVESSTGIEVGITDFESLPFGSCEDPVESLQLSVTWPRLSADLVVDDESYSDLNPVKAPKWSMRVHVLPSPQCLLGDYLDSFVQLCTRRESMMQLLGRSLSEDVTSDAPDVSQALSRLTDPTYGLPNLSSVISKTTTVVTRATGKLQMKPEEAPLQMNTLNEILLYLFPDAKEDQEKCGKGKIEGGTADSGELSRLSENDTINNLTDEQAEEATEATGEQISDIENQMQELYKQFKSAPVNSFPYRLAVVMCVINNYGGVRSVAHLWQEVVLEMRYRWENNYIIPELEPGSPNMACSLLYQKFQMLNCCILRKKCRESDSSHFTRTQETCHDGAETKGAASSAADEWKWDVSESASSDDEFFEAMETTEADEDKSKTSHNNSNNIGAAEAGPSSSKRKNKGAAISDTTVSGCPAKRNKAKTPRPVSSGPSLSAECDQGGRVSQASVSDVSMDDTDLDISFKDTVSYQPEGRVKPHGDMKLLNNQRQSLYVPVTQEPAPMTEDMLEEHAEVLAKLGTSNEGTHLRARLQSACLLSDMESFKAANPGATLGDFVRWYSPRDWVEVEENDDEGNIITKGQLSARMQIPGNLWVEVWQNAKAIPARRQRRLFDDTKEAEKVLHWLAAMKPAEVALRLLPMCAHAALHKLLEQPEVQQLPMFPRLLDTLIRKGSTLLRASRLDSKPVEEYMRQIARVEVLVTQAQSLREKFLESSQGSKDVEEILPQTICRLLEQTEVEIVGGSQGPLGSVLRQLFIAANKSRVDGSDSESDGESNSKAASKQLKHEPTYKTSSEFPEPVAKEFILRTSVPRPTPWSRSCPQRMYCQIAPEEFRLMGAFTSDTTFQ